MYKVLFSLCLIFSNISAEDKYLDADSLELENIAQNALQNSKIVHIQDGRVIEIVGVALGIEGISKDLNAKVIETKTKIVDIEEILEDLNAKVTETEIKIEMSGDVLFDFDKAAIRKEAEPTLKNVIEVIEKYNAKNVLIKGHTDSKGSNVYNLKLSIKRANSVRKWLVKNSTISKKIIQAKGRGEIEPIAQNINKDGSDNPQGRQKNRRVEIIVKK